MRTPVIGGNWKMYKDPAETTSFFDSFRPLVEHSVHREIDGFLVGGASLDPVNFASIVNL